MHTSKAFYVPRPNTCVRHMTHCLEVANSDDIKKVVMQEQKEPLEGISAMRKPRTPETVIKIPKGRNF